MLDLKLELYVKGYFIIDLCSVLANYLNTKNNLYELSNKYSGAKRTILASKM